MGAFLRCPRPHLPETAFEHGIEDSRIPRPLRTAVPEDELDMKSMGTGDSPFWHRVLMAFAVHVLGGRA